MSNASAPIVWTTGQAFIVKASPVEDGLDRLTDKWMFRNDDGIFGAVGLIARLRQRRKFAGAWQVVIRDLDAPKDADPVWQAQYPSQHVAEEAAFDVTRVVKAGRLPALPPSV
jgi:hypothetical protein